MFLCADKYVSFYTWIYIEKCDSALIFINLCAWNISFYYLAKDAVFHNHHIPPTKISLMSSCLIFSYAKNTTILLSGGPMPTFDTSCDQLLLIQSYLVNKPFCFAFPMLFTNSHVVMINKAMEVINAIDIFNIFIGCPFTNARMLSNTCVVGI